MGDEPAMREWAEALVEQARAEGVELTGEHGLLTALEPTHGKGLRRNWAVLDADRCLGCGVCHDVCRYGAHGMEPRNERPAVPATTVERELAMAIDSGRPDLW